MRPSPVRTLVRLLPALLCIATGLSAPVTAQLATVNLCADGAGNIGTNWVSLPTVSDMTTAEELCLSIPGALTVAQGTSDATGPLSRRWSFDCATSVCTSSQPIPEPGCAASACFCLERGEGIEVVPSAATPWDVNFCDTFETITLPAGFQNYLVSIPYDTFLATANDLANHVGLPNTGVQRGTVTRTDCVTGAVTTCQAGTVACDTLAIVPGQAYRIRYPAPTPGVTFTNPVSCAPLPAPDPALCPIDDLVFGDAERFGWTAPDRCALPAVYDSIRGDLGCLRGGCRQSVTPPGPACAGCVLLEDDDIDTTTVDADVPALGLGFWYHARVDAGTWRDPVAAGACVDRDALFAAGCP